MSENILNNFEFMTKKPPLQNHKIKMHYFRFDGFSFGGLLEYILQHTLAKFQPAMTCNSQNTSQNTQKHQKHAILLSKPVALYGIGQVINKGCGLIIILHIVHNIHTLCPKFQAVRSSS